MVRLAARIERVEPSPTLAISAKAKALVAQGVDVISFGAGEPDFGTPDTVVEAAKAALDAGWTRYGAASGDGDLKAAIAADYARRNREVSPTEVIVSAGGKHALYNATQVLFEAGDKVLIPSPYWVSYPAQVKLADAEPIAVPCGIDTEFKLTPDALRAACEEHDPRGLILCSPSNPTGATLSAEELRGLADVLADFPDVVVFFDGMYDRLCYDAPFAADLVAVAPELADRAVTFNGFSKTYAMTGWRLGYAIGPSAIIAAMGRLQSQSTSNPTTFSQRGALAAFDLDDAVIAERREVFRARRDAIVGMLNDIAGVRCAVPGGAFYVFPDFGSFVGPDARFANDLALSEYLLEQARVAVVPGSAFGAEGFLRLSYATSDEAIAEGVSRIAQALT
jgi:aspartate aminotransferase